jgi:hypothetical protein
MTDRILHVALAMMSLLLVSRDGLCASGKDKSQPVTDGGGFFRVVNTGQHPNAYLFVIRFHRDPWRSNNKVGFANEDIPAGGATEWVHLPRLTKLRPITLQIMTRVMSGARLKKTGGTQELNTGRIEFAESIPRQPQPALPTPLPDIPLALSATSLLRAIEMNGKPITVEIEQPAFTKAEQIRQDVEIGAATLEIVRGFPFKGKAPERFPTGWANGTLDEYRAGRVLGFTAIMAGTPKGLPDTLFTDLGYRYIYSYTHWLGMWGTQGGGGYRRENNRKEMQKVASMWRDAGLIDRVIRVSLRDEASMYSLKSSTAGGLKDMYKDPSAWAECIRWAGLKPEDFVDPANPPPAGAATDSREYWQALRGAGPDMRETDPLRVYNTMQVWQATWSARFGNVREALQEAFGRPVPCTANIHFETYFRDRGGFDPWNEYSLRRTLDIPQVCDYGVGWPQQEEFLIDLQRCAMRPHTGRVDAMLQAQERYMPRPALHLKLCSMSAIGAGAGSLSFYRWGPRYLDTENWYNSDTNRLRVIGEINHAVGWVEDILLDGEPRQARLAMMWSRSGSMWDMLTPAPDQPSPGMYFSNLRTTYHLLRGLHHQVDFINDAVLPQEQGVDMDHYRVIFIMQRCMPRKAATELLAWAERGGTLIGILSIGQFDHLETPSPQMMEAFGLKSLEVLSGGDEEKSIPTAGIVLRNADSRFARLQVGDAEVIHQFQDGSPAVTRKKHGKGELIYAAFEPGHAYHRFTEPVNARAKELRLLTGMQESARALVAEWVRPAGVPFCQTSHPLVSARLIQDGNRAAVILVNSSAEEEIPDLRLIIKGISPSRAISLEKGNLALARESEGVSMVFKMGRTDVVRLE